jgi:hypothetical protein
MINIGPAEKCRADGCGNIAWSNQLCAKHLWEGVPEKRRRPEEYDDAMRAADPLYHHALTDDPVNHPAHYAGKVETIDAIESALSAEGYQGYLRGNVLKYLSRMGKKGPALEDARKAQWYLGRLIISLGGLR